MERAVPRPFAVAAARHHAVPLVQIDPTGIRLRAIAAGRYDAYLRSYAAAVRAYGGRVVLSFGHEMNGNWYSWGYHHATRRRSWPPGGTSSPSSGSRAPAT